MKKLILIFSGYNQRAVIAFLRTLEKNKISNYRILASSEKDTILKTIYRNMVFYTRKIEQLDLDEICNAINQLQTELKVKTILIAPSTEALNRFLLKYRIILEEHHCIIPLVDGNLYEKISDKKSFWNMCKENGLLVPKVVPLGSKFEKPIVAKPKKYFSKNKRIYSPVLIETEQQYKEFVEKYSLEDFMYQEFVVGQSFYLLFYFAQNGKVYCFSQQNIAQQPNGKSILIACCANLHMKNSIVLNYIDLFRNSQYYGFVMVELRKRNEEFYMIEANPRFWGPSQLFCDCGYNFFEFFLFEYGFLHEPVQRKINYDAKYFWSGGIKGKVLESDNCVWYGEGKRIFEEKREEFAKSDIYFRQDTMNIYEEEKDE